MGSIATAAQYRGRFNYLPRGTKLNQTSTSAYELPALANFTDSPLLPLTDIRSSLDLGDESPYKLSSHGFTARRYESRLHSSPYDCASWSNENLLRSIYFPEVEELLKKVTGCKRAVPTGAILRSDLYSEGDPSSMRSGKQESDKLKENEESPSPTTGQAEDEPTSLNCAAIYGNRPGDGVSTAPKVHLDFTPRGARRQIRKHHRDLALLAEPVIQAENKLLRSGIDWDDLKDHYNGNSDGEEGIPRFALFSVWRPLKTVKRDPLGVTSCNSFPKADYVTQQYLDVSFSNDIPPNISEIIDPVDPQSKNPENQHKSGKYPTWAYIAHAPTDPEGKTHGWHFISDQQPEEVVIIQFFDNEMEATSRAPQDAMDTSPELAVCGSVHSSFELEGQEDVEARESLEVRCTAFW